MYMLSTLWMVRHECVKIQVKEGFAGQEYNFKSVWRPVELVHEAVCAFVDAITCPNAS
jgi:hypothetical protein